uniref:Uncharacterized protein n=1 Tax=Cannabis sativa TaxID=3483 RepID=A0A803P2Z9_CANSA
MAKYCKNKSFWEVEGKGGDSPLWKGILESRGIIQLGGLAILGRGDSIDIWNQPWIPWLNYNEFYDLLQRIKSSNPHLKTVADLSVQDNCWNLDLLQQLFGRDLGARIGLIPRLPTSVEDTMVWKKSTDRAFTVKRAHQIDVREDDIFKDIILGLVSCIPTDLKCKFLEFTGCLFDGIWSAGNESLFKGKAVDIHNTRSNILRRFQELNQIQLGSFSNVSDKRHGEVTDMRQTSVAAKISSNTEIVCLTNASWKDGVVGLAVGW